ncbi:unnamed protein product [Toxocara canis]|uniref:TIL domain-containing protein n=1 Tax=Toxocara canis TaxID=6265 RepID=A0A183UWG4_TOXCA|nr:unnamed protein product [Toxocara canis]
MMTLSIVVMTVLALCMNPAMTQTDSDESEPSEASRRLCTGNTTWVTCSGCEPRCGQNRPEPCPASCGPPRCECRRGYVRDTNGRCVLPRDCSRSRCARNEVYRTCRTCEGTCDNPNPRCTRNCRPAGCECPVSDGYVRDRNGNCIDKSDCPPTCRGFRCPRGQHCELRPVVCVRAPCYPQPTCVWNRD